MKIYINDQNNQTQIKSQIQSYMEKQNDIEDYLIDTSLQQDFYDIAFLYIDDHIQESFELTTRLKEQNPQCQVLFLSHTYQYVHVAFALHIYQYIHIPCYSFDEIIQKTMISYRKRNIKFIMHTTKGNIVFRSKEIIYIESYYNQLRIVTDKQIYVTNIKQKSHLFQILKTLSFIQIQRSYMMNMNYVLFFSEDGVFLKNKVFLPISPLRKEQIMIEYNKFQEQ